MMYQDQDTIRLFERQHARDRIVDLARQCQDAPSLDLFDAHTKAEHGEASLNVLMSLTAVAALVGLVALAW